MQKSGLQSVVRIIGFLLLPVAGFFCLLCIPIGEFGLSLVFGIVALAAFYLIRGAPQLLRAVDASQNVTNQHEADHAFVQVGGARIGWTNATWPLARLFAGPDKLTLSVRLLGDYTFAPNEVSSIERYTVIPILGWGVRIHHSKVDYPERVIFWCRGNPDSILDGIRNSGFLATAPASALAPRRGIPIRWSVIIITGLIWNGLLLLDVRHSGQIPPPPGPFSLVALSFFFALSLGTLKSAQFQRLILKPGRNVGEIRPFLRLVVFVSGFVLIFFTIFWAFGTFNEVPHPSSPTTP